MALPKIVQCHEVHIFNFYRDGALHEGIHYSGKLYRLIEIFPNDKRLQASALGCKLGGSIVITVSEAGFKVWGEMRLNIPWTPKQPLTVPALSAICG